jgi:hypothetical protein
MHALKAPARVASVVKKPYLQWDLYESFPQLTSCFHLAISLTFKRKSLSIHYFFITTLSIGREKWK